MKKPLLVTIADTHLKESTIETNLSVFKQAIDKAKKLKLTKVYHIGDVFDSRKAQPLKILTTFYKILELFKDAKIELIAIPGNHDKSDYSSEESFLDVFTDHTSLTLIRDFDTIMEKDVAVHLIPFFDEKTTYDQYLKDLLATCDSKVKKNILLTHIAVDGVRNNDGSKIEDHLSPKKFEFFDKVLVGHYHNKQEVKNISYTGSAFCQNYGEDNEKGLTIVYDDLSTEQFVLQFKQFNVVKLDLDVMTVKELELIKKEYANSKENVRFKLEGSPQKIAKLDKATFDKLGIDIKCEFKIAEFDDEEELKGFSGFDSKIIKEEWGLFCEKNDIGEVKTTEGKKQLENIL